MIFASCFAVVSCWLALGKVRMRLRAEECEAEAEELVSGTYAQPGAIGTVDMATSLTPKLSMLCLCWRKLMFWEGEGRSREVEIRKLRVRSNGRKKLYTDLDQEEQAAYKKQSLVIHNVMGELSHITTSYFYCSYITLPRAVL
jgi:hypothetical protein